MHFLAAVLELSNKYCCREIYDMAPRGSHRSKRRYRLFIHHDMLPLEMLVLQPHAPVVVWQQLYWSFEQVKIHIDTCAL